VNSVTGVIERTAEEVTEAEKIVRGAQYAEGVTRLEGGILFIYNLEHFLSGREAATGRTADSSGGKRVSKRIPDAQLLQLGDVVDRHLGPAPLSWPEPTNDCRLNWSTAIALKNRSRN
jgi:hypothetical protein